MSTSGFGNLTVFFHSSLLPLLFLFLPSLLSSFFLPSFWSFLSYPSIWIWFYIHSILNGNKRLHIRELYSNGITQFNQWYFTQFDSILVLIKGEVSSDDTWITEPSSSPCHTTNTRVWTPVSLLLTETESDQDTEVSSVNTTDSESTKTKKHLPYILIYGVSKHISVKTII